MVRKPIKKKSEMFSVLAVGMVEAMGVRVDYEQIFLLMVGCKPLNEPLVIAQITQTEGRHVVDTSDF